MIQKVKLLRNKILIHIMKAGIRESLQFYRCAEPTHILLLYVEQNFLF